MLDISIIPKMETIDCLRSGALVVAVTALLLGSSRSSSKKKSADRVGLWLFGESIGMGIFGSLLIALPEVLLGHVTTGDLDPFHLFQTRMLGTVIVGCAVTSYLFIDSPNREMWLLARLLSAMALVVTMAMAHSKPVKKGVKYSDRVYFLSPDEGGRKKPYTNNYQSSLFCKTWNAPAVLQLQGKEMVMPGEDIPCKFVCTKFMVIEKGLRFTLRDSGNTLGYGVITDIHPDVNIEEFNAARKAEKKAKMKAEMNQ